MFRNMILTMTFVGVGWFFSSGLTWAAVVADPNLLDDLTYPLRSRINDAFAGLTLSYHGTPDPGWSYTGDVVRLYSGSLLESDLFGHRSIPTSGSDYYADKWGNSFFGRYIYRPVDLDSPVDAVFADAVNYGSSNKNAQLTAYDAEGIELGRTNRDLWAYASPTRIQFTTTTPSIHYFTVTNNVYSIFGFQVNRAGTGKLQDSDFNADGAADVDDVNQLLTLGDLTVGVPVTLGVNDTFDLNGDGSIDEGDLDQWLADAAVLNGVAQPYKRGDANLDGYVDVSDFNNWNTAKFTTNGWWDSGDFNGSGATDVSDFNLWNVNKFTSSHGVSSVPESTSLVLLWFLLVIMTSRRAAVNRLGSDR